MSDLGLEYLWIKDEGKNPTASFKDRASSVVVARAMEIKAEVVVTASTGNAGAALAGMAAAMGQKAVILHQRMPPGQGGTIADLWSKSDPGRREL